jgi:hypothetical protein
LFLSFCRPEILLEFRRRGRLFWCLCSRARRLSHRISSLCTGRQLEQRMWD